MTTYAYNSLIYYIRLGIKKNKFEQEIWEIDKEMHRLDVLLSTMKEKSTSVISIFILIKRPYANAYLQWKKEKKIKAKDIRKYFEL